MTAPDWLLERYALGEVSAAERQRVESDPTSAARLAELEHSNAAILVSHPPARVASRLTQKKSPRRPASFLVLVPLGAALALVMVRGTQGDTVTDTVEVTRLKGQAASLHVYRRLPSGAEELRIGSVARPHDILQLGYVPAGRAYGVVVSIDGQGAVTQHFPDPGAEAKLGKGGEIPLPHAYELDDAPGFERFFFVTSDAPLTAADVVRAARRLAARPDAMRAPLELPHTEEASFLLRKAN